LQQLFVETLQLLKNSMEENNDHFTKSDAITFEEALITLCLFCIGGQRREFIVNITLQVNFYFFLNILNTF
jgi:hypothetical protein